MNEKHKAAVETHLSKARINLELAGKQATSRAESSLVEALHWLHMAADSMKTEYEGKIAQLEAELQVAKDAVSGTKVGAVEDLAYFESKILTSSGVPTSYISLEETAEITETTELVKDEIVEKVEPFLLEEIIVSSFEEPQNDLVEEQVRLFEEEIKQPELDVVEQSKKPVELKVAPKLPAAKMPVSKVEDKQEDMFSAPTPKKAAVKKK
jgi:hypothetical protein